MTSSNDTLVPVPLRQSVSISRQILDGLEEPGAAANALLNNLKERWRASNNAGPINLNNRDIAGLEWMQDAYGRQGEEISRLWEEIARLKAENEEFTAGHIPALSTFAVLSCGYDHESVTVVAQRVSRRRDTPRNVVTYRPESSTGIVNHLIWIDAQVAADTGLGDSIRITVSQHTEEVVEEESH